jgi:hypothetical protein
VFKWELRKSDGGGGGGYLKVFKFFLKINHGS